MLTLLTRTAHLPPAKAAARLHRAGVARHPARELAAAVDYVRWYCTDEKAQFDLLADLCWTLHR